MNYKTGFQAIVLPWMMVMLHIVDSCHSPKRTLNTHLSCKPKQLASLTIRQVENSLTQFDEANGKHLGIWLPGFPELTVEQNSIVVGSKVQCSLLFLAQGLGRILDDQRNDLNPEDVSLHRVLKESMSRVCLFAACLQGVLGGKCSPPPAPPEMPLNTFERKQWSHTLLTAATHYLQWLQHQLPTLKKHWQKDLKEKAIKYQLYIEGSGHLL